MNILNCSNIGVVVQEIISQIKSNKKYSTLISYIDNETGRIETVRHNCDIMAASLLINIMNHSVNKFVDSVMNQGNSTPPPQKDLQALPTQRDGRKYFRKD